MLKWIILAVVILALIALVLANIRVVPQSKAFVLERLGTFYATWETGLHVKIPFIDRIAKTVSLKEQVVDFKPQAVITKDNVTMQIDTVVFFRSRTPSCTPTVWKAPFLPLRICLPPRCVILSARWSWTAPSLPATPSTPRSG